MTAKTHSVSIPDPSVADLAQLGGGDVGYIKEIGVEEARRLLGGQATVSPKSKLFCLYDAGGTPISISGSREAALGSAVEHELLPMSVH
jgi:hypothetical protein